MEKALGLAVMVAKFCEILKTAELYTLKGQFSRYVAYILIKLLFQEMLDVFAFIMNSAFCFLSTQAPALLPNLHSSQESRRLPPKSLTSYLIWTGLERPVGVEIALEKGSEGGV